MSLIAVASLTLSSSASEKHGGGRKAMKVRALGVRKLKKENRTGRPVVVCLKNSYSSHYSRWDVDKA